MPRSTREYLKRYNDQIINDFNRIVDNCARIRDIYDEGGYEQAAFYIALGQTAIEMRDLVERFKAEKV